MAATLNKDGTPRKTGSGKTKGAGCFAKIKWEQLREFVQDDENILVSRVWLRSVGALNQKKGSKKKITKITTTAKFTSKTLLPKASTTLPKLKAKEENKVTPNYPKGDEDDYDPPPLFASMGEIKKY
jgi:hypothetical protein